MSKLPSISSIFDKNKDGSYTSKALFYQDIIRYGLVLFEKGKDNSLRVRELTRWLLDNNIDFLNSRRDLSNRNKQMSNLIEDRIDRVRKNVAALCLLHIMDERGTAKQMKGKGDVTLYQYTFHGVLLALIIESFNPIKYEECVNEIYQLWQSRLMEDKGPIDIFTHNIFEKYKENEVFGLFVVDRIREFINSGSHIGNVNDIIESISFLRTNDMGKAKQFINLWQETWDELDSQTRGRLSHHFKSEIELEMSKQAISHDEYEEHRFALRNDPEKVSLEAMCRECGVCYYVSVLLVPYLRRRKIPQSGPKFTMCPSCKIRTLEIPSL